MRGREVDYHFLLTAALGTYDDIFKMIEWQKVEKNMDYFNMMTYDFSSTWSADTNHNSPLSLISWFRYRKNTFDRYGFRSI
jgi:GH18 family chitinase